MNILLKMSKKKKQQQKIKRINTARYQQKHN